MQKLKQSFLIITVGLALAAGLSYAWTGPTVNPPGNNAPAPINVLGDDPNTTTVTEGFQQFTGTKNLQMGDGLTQGLGILGFIWTNGLIQTTTGLWTKGGTNAPGWSTHFPYSDGVNYIRGTTIIADSDANNKVGIGTVFPGAKLGITSTKINEKSLEVAANDKQRMFMVPWLGSGGYNPITSSGDKGIFWTTPDAGDDSTGALVIAPWAATGGGIKINKNGSLRIVDGTEGMGKVLTSDADGNAKWAAGGGGGGGGSGTTDYLSKWTNSTTLGNSQIYDDGSRVGIGTVNPVYGSKLDVSGSIRVNEVVTNEFSPNSGYPSTWIGGIHTKDVYSDGGSIATGSNGKVSAAMYTNGWINGSGIKLTGGAGDGKVLTSDADGNASWKTLAPTVRENAGTVHCGAKGVTNTMKLGSNHFCYIQEVDANYHNSGDTWRGVYPTDSPNAEGKRNWEVGIRCYGDEGGITATCVNF